MTRLAFAALALSLLVAPACATVGRPASGAAPPAPPASAAADRTADAPGAPRAPELLDADPLTGPCSETCDHILAIAAPETPGPEAAAWMEACQAACVEHASAGQLTCYQRVDAASDLDACTVR